MGIRLYNVIGLKPMRRIYIRRGLISLNVVPWYVWPWYKVSLVTDSFKTCKQSTGYCLKPYGPFLYTLYFSNVYFMNGYSRMLSFLFLFFSNSKLSFSIWLANPKCTTQPVKHGRVFMVPCKKWLFQCMLLYTRHFLHGTI